MRRHALRGLTKIDEYGVSFETGKPASFRFIRNTEKSPNFGPRFQQDIEPAGRYFLHSPPSSSPPPQWERGEVRFERPLVLEFNESGEHTYNEHSWKAWLQRQYGGKKGRALTCALKREGYDGIVTVAVDRQRRPLDTLEIVDLRPVPCPARKGKR